MSVEAAREMQESRVDEWVPLCDASRVTGRSIGSLRELISENKLYKVKKVTGKGFSCWLIHRDILSDIGSIESSDNDECQPEASLEDAGCIGHEVHKTDSVPLEYHDRKMKEWLAERDQLMKEWMAERDNLMHGIMMYQLKFEDLDRRMKMLPSPPEIATEELKRMAEAEERLTEKENVISEKEIIITEKDQVITKKERVILEKEQVINEAHKIIRDAQEIISKREEALRELRHKLEEEERNQEILRSEWKNAIEEAKRPWWLNKIRSYKKK